MNPQDGAQEKIRTAFEELTAAGQALAGSVDVSSPIIKDRFQAAAHETQTREFLTFRTRALNLVQRVCGLASTHHTELLSIALKGESPSLIHQCLGVLKAAEDDFRGGFLFDLRSLVAAELLGDFLEQAEELLSAGFVNPAASLAGAVLEDSLRKLCDLKKFSHPKKTSINALNTELAKAQVYNTLVQKQITVYADIRKKRTTGTLTSTSRRT